jgi:hypothetical protein
MMKHEQIESAIERLRKISYGARKYNALEAVEAVIPDGSWVDGLIDLLEQADPDTHMELPVDADGVPIHFGDELTDPHHAGNFTVEAIGGNNGFIPHVVYFRGNGGNLRFYYTNQCHHYYSPTVEDVLRQFADVGIRIGAKHGIKAGEFTFTADEDAVAEYAAKLREVMADDDAR